MSHKLDAAIQVWPIDLPKDFLRRLGYFHIANQPQRYVGLFWADDDAAGYDDGRTAIDYGYLHDYEYLGYFWRPTVDGFVRANELDFESADEVRRPAKHWLIVDSESNEAFFAPASVARRVVKLQRLHDLAGIDLAGKVEEVSA